VAQAGPEEEGAGRIWEVAALFVRDTDVAAAAYTGPGVRGPGGWQKVPGGHYNSRLACLGRFVGLSEEEHRRDRRSIRAAAEVAADVAFQNSKKTLYASSPAAPSCHAAWTPRS
jgi:hypothetical protein